MINMMKTTNKFTHALKVIEIWGRRKKDWKLYYFANSNLCFFSNLILNHLTHVNVLYFKYPFQDHFYVVICVNVLAPAALM